MGSVLFTKWFTLRTCGLILLCVSSVISVDIEPKKPWIVSFSVNAKSCVQNNCKYLLNVRGGEYLGHLSWRLTPNVGVRGGSCDIIYPSYELREVLTAQWHTNINISVPLSEEKIFFCLFHSDEHNTPFGGKWVHQGEDLYLDPRNDEVCQIMSEEESRTTESYVKAGQDTTVAPATERDSDMQLANLQEADNKPWADLTHDTDVNYQPGAARPTREEAEHIEVVYKDKYVPLNSLIDIKEANVKQSRDFDLNNALFLSNDIEFVRNRRGVKEEVITNNKHDKAINQLVRINRDIDEINKELINNNKQHKTVNQFVRINRDINVVDKNVINNNKHDKSINQLVRITRDIDVMNKKIINNNKHDKTVNQLVRINRDIDEMNKEVVLNNKHDKAADQLVRNNRDIDEVSNRSTNVLNRSERQTTDGNYMDTFTSVKAIEAVLQVDGIRIEESDKEPKTVENGVPSVLAESRMTLRLFGQGLTDRTVIAFTTFGLEYGNKCKFILPGEYLVRADSVAPYTALFDVIAPPTQPDPKLYVCAKNLKPGISDPSNDQANYIHQGTEPFKSIATHNALLPLWVSMCLIICCLTFSALFSGLNLGLMSLDRTELKIISNTGTEQERKYARAIMPVRDHGNYLLCSILLGNVAVNSTFTILLDELTSGLFAVIFSTLAIVLLGEITPQAICSRHGLMVGAKSIVVTKAVMAITAPLAYPVSKLLDYFLGEEIGSVYNRERLKELVKVTTDVNDLDKDEVNIISGALELRKKTVSDVMTQLEDVFMLPITSVLDFETMSEIVKSGYSRIPVYEAKRNNIITVLFIKDLAFVDPDDNTPLRTLCQYYQNHCNFVFEDVTLDVMFKQFKDGHKGHMAFVHRINNEGEGDPFYETIGLVTLEDVIEELIQAEIVDETDVFMDNRSKRRRNRPQNKLQDFAAFAERHENQRIHISPQLTLATFQFLSTSVDAFRPEAMSESVLRRLLRQDVIHHIKVKGKNRKDPTTYVFHEGKPVDYFVLILEGRVEVTVGRENLVFEAGPFTYFGVQALVQNVGVAESPTPSAMGSLQNMNMESLLRHTFVPDYSVRAISDVFYLTVKRSLYLAAKRATLMEKGAFSKGATNEQFDTEVDKTPDNANTIELMQMNPHQSTSSDRLYGLPDYICPELSSLHSVLNEIVDNVFKFDGMDAKTKRAHFDSSPTLVMYNAPSTSYLRDDTSGSRELDSRARSVDAHCDRLLRCQEPECFDGRERDEIETKLDRLGVEVLYKLEKILNVLEGKDQT